MGVCDLAGISAAELPGGSETRDLLLGKDRQDAVGICTAPLLELLEAVQSGAVIMESELGQAGEPGTFKAGVRVVAAAVETVQGFPGLVAVKESGRVDD